MHRSDQNQATKEQQGTAQPTHRWPTRPTDNRKVNNLPDLAQDSGAERTEEGRSGVVLSLSIRGEAAQREMSKGPGYSDTTLALMGCGG
jgi:hypothetical protein